MLLSLLILSYCFYASTVANTMLLLPCCYCYCYYAATSAFSTTINKAQGQTLKTIGVWLPEPVFSHGQLYVAASRVRAPEKLKFALKPVDAQHSTCTRNVVYREVLTNNLKITDQSEVISLYQNKKLCLSYFINFRLIMKFSIL